MFTITGNIQNPEDCKKRLLEIIQTKSYREGKFTLASGKESNFYLDLKETSLDQEGIALAASLMARLLDEEKLEAFAVGGLTMGADPLGTAVSLAAGLRGKRLQSFIVRKQPKDHGTLAWIEGAKAFPPGAKLVVLEDVVTTGGSSLKAVEKLREAGFQVEAIITVMDREEGGEATITKAGIKFFRLCALRELSAKNRAATN